MDPLVSLSAASIALVGTHFALSHPLRAPLVVRIGEKGFLVLYSLVALGCIMWMARSFRAAPAADLGGATGEVGWILASLLTLPALVLFLGSLRSNPAFPGVNASHNKAPRGVFAATRHPMMWGFALWAISHLVLWWSWRTIIVASAILILALVGAHLQDRKKAALAGRGWTEWAAQTTYWPRWSSLPGAGVFVWSIAIGAWLMITWLHIPMAGVAAGLWRFIG